MGLTTEEKILLYERYITLIEKRLSGISGSFIRYYPYLAIQRNLQILGAFSYLGNVQGKKWFLGYIPPALESLEGLLEERDDPELHQLKTLIKKINGVSIEAQGDHQSDG